LTLSITLLTAAPDAISGEWQATFLIADNDVPITLKLQLSGDKVSGTSESSHMGPGTVTGTWKANKLSFNLESGHGSVTATGELKDGKLAGEFSSPQGMHGKWQATRPAAK
jgi:hypothetical protein